MRQSGHRAPGDCGSTRPVPQSFNKERNPICRRVSFSARRLPQCGFKRMPRRKYASHQRRSAAGQVMKRESIEERIKSYFKLERGACARLLSEVQDCYESSVYLDAILKRWAPLRQPKKRR